MLIKLIFTALTLCLSAYVAYHWNISVRNKLHLHEALFRFAQSAKINLETGFLPITSLLDALPIKLDNDLSFETLPRELSTEYREQIVEYLSSYNTLCADDLKKATEDFLACAKDELADARERTARDAPLSITLPPLCALLLSIAVF